MHDVAVIQGILDAVLEKAEAFLLPQPCKPSVCGASESSCFPMKALGKNACGKGKRVNGVKLEVEIGALRFVDQENARFWLTEMLKKEFGPELKTKISIKTIAPEIKCKCGFEGRASGVHATHDMVHAGIFEMHCPKCGGRDFEILKGKDVLIAGLEFK